MAGCIRIELMTSVTISLFFEVSHNEPPEAVSPEWSRALHQPQHPPEKSAPSEVFPLLGMWLWCLKSQVSHAGLKLFCCLRLPGGLIDSKLQHNKVGRTRFYDTVWALLCSGTCFGLADIVATPQVIEEQTGQNLSRKQKSVLFDIFSIIFHPYSALVSIMEQGDSSYVIDVRW